MKQVMVGIVWVLLAAWAMAQQHPSGDFPPQLPTKPPSTDNIPPHSPDAAGESSSKDTKIDLSPPKYDAKEHPNSGVTHEVLKLKTYDPHKAQKAIEIGDFYYKRENYQAALSRYQEALQWKPNDAEATFRSAESLAKLGRLPDAQAGYEAYLKLLPEGPHAKEAHNALSKLPAAPAQPSASAPVAGSSKD